MLITVTNPFKERPYHAEVILPGSGPAQKVSLRPAFNGLQTLTRTISSPLEFRKTGGRYKFRHLLRSLRRFFGEAVLVGEGIFVSHRDLTGSMHPTLAGRLAQ